MEPLLDAITVFAACTDLSVDVVKGEIWPRLTIRQGPGAHLCGRALLGIAPYLAVGTLSLSLLSRFGRARPGRRIR